MRRSLRNNGGFTLAEVVVASVLVAMSLSGIWGLLHWLMYSTYLGGRQIGAVYAAEQKMEELFSAPATSGSDTLDGFSRTWTITVSSNSQRKVDVNISWTDPRGRTNGLNMQSAISTVVTSFTGVSFPNLFVGVPQ